MTSCDRSLPPFAAALGDALDRVAPVVRRHLAPSERRTLHEGALRRLWWRGPLGWLAARSLHLDRVDGNNAEVRFELRNELITDASGGIVMLWQRIHYPGTRPISGVGILRWDAIRGVLVDTIGKRKWLEVELVPSVDGAAVVMTSKSQWLRIGGARLRLPRLLFGSAHTRESQESDGRLGLSLTLHHPLFGAYAGYEAVFVPA